MLYSLCYAQTRTLLFLIFLTYLIFTEFEPPSMFCHCKPRHTSLFLWRLVNKRILRGRIRKDSSLFPFFFFFFFFFFFTGSLVGLDIFFNLGGGTPWVVTTSGLLPDDTGIQWNISKFGGTSPALSIPYNSSESNIQINICLFQLWFWHLQFHGEQL